jgi:hypothetical protein
MHVLQVLQDKKIRKHPKFFKQILHVICWLLYQLEQNLDGSHQTLHNSHTGHGDLTKPITAFASKAF